MQMLMYRVFRISQAATLLAAITLMSCTKVSSSSDDGNMPCKFTGERAFNTDIVSSPFAEACDMQTLYSLSKSATPGSAALVTTYADGTITPAKEMGEIPNQSVAPFEAGRGVRMGYVQVQAPIKSLQLFDKKVHEVWIHHSAQDGWTASYDNDPAVLKIVRYTYVGLTKNHDYPPTARWDWDDETGDPVMGFPCAHAWCLLGTKSQGPEAQPDPHDSVYKYNLDPLSVPRTRRVRGWYDRLIDLNGTNAYLYPQPDIEDYADDSEFDEEAYPHRVMANLVVDKATAEVPIEIFRKGGSWMSITKNKPNKPAKGLKHKGNPGYIFMPGAARFGTGLYESMTFKGTFKLGVVSPLAAIGDGDMWVRCASGCCNATIDQ